MSATTLVRSQLFFNGGMGFGPCAAYKKDNGTYVVERQPVFRSGTFRDSWGDQATYEPIHIKQMVENFHYLRGNATFPEVPARDGHAGFLIHGLPGNGRVVGWHTDISVETMQSPVNGLEHDYLLASYEITEPDAVEKVQRGTWRNRSSEILRYVTNDEAEFWPVYGGFAFVDIPAVEGLNFNRDNGARPDGNESRTRYFVMSDRETNVTSPAPGSPAQPSQPTPASPAPSQPAQPTAPAPSNPPMPTPSSPPAQPSQHSNGGVVGGSYMFTINGQATSDFAAVQRHISALEAQATEARNAVRADFVNSLVSANLILGNAENIAAQTAFAQSLTDEQFATWRSGFVSEARPALLSQHATPAASTGGVVGAAAPGAPGNDQIAIDRETVKFHRSLGRTPEQLAKMPSYQRLVAAGVEK